MWKKLINTWDVVVYEKKYKDFNVKIEARLSEENKWEVFKKYTGKDGLDHIEHFVANSADELHFILKKLMKKSLSIKEIENIKLSRAKQPKVNLKREFKEYGMEKWKFNINGEKINNLIFIKFDEVIELDVILHESYKSLKEKIAEEITNTFNLEEQGTDVELKVYFYNNSSQEFVEQKDNLIGKVEIGYDPEE
ncbi:MAG: hypothetical protein ACOCQG_03705 [Candidatus Nanoarchaeia archaeon]